MPEPLKRWQNLIFKKCPKCNRRLEDFKSPNLPMMRCLESACEFMIRRRAWADILLEETHVMRRFLTKHEAETLETAVKELAKA